jgi:hypothetical protein
MTNSRPQQRIAQQFHDAAEDFARAAGPPGGLRAVEAALRAHGHEVHRLYSVPKLFAYKRNGGDMGTQLIAALIERDGRLFLIGDAKHALFSSGEPLAGAPHEIVTKIEARAGLTQGCDCAVDRDGDQARPGGCTSAGVEGKGRR